ncbi:iron-siderophore ABC transporter substrate-binding protein [Mycolicibacterium litorale]|uniref:iron-siderophore ABC transporter substrate-binding protein n=1 Tax=Mycolicibacterium litorale TaxID=758802 RepID=UPI003CF7DA73
MRTTLSATLVAALATALAGCGSSGGDTAASAPMASVITSTTAVAGAGVLGNDRRPDESCAPEPAAVDPGPPQREVRHAAGETRVAADPQRIAVLSGDQLDALCALGLQSRIVAAALPDGQDQQPSYLGAVIHDVAPAGTRSAPDLDAIRAAAPDLILGSQALTPELYGDLGQIAPTVFTGPPGADWQANLRTVGAATGRFGAAGGLLDGFADAARRTGADNDAGHWQVSVVQLTDDTVRVFGADNFAGSVLTEVGLDRPAAQRFTDRPYVEIGTDGSPDYSIADADIVYVSFASAGARDRAPKVLDSDAWRALSAAQDDRVYIVNNEVWQTGQGIVAARGVLLDLRWVNAPIN